MKRFILRIVSGSFAGTEYPLPWDRQLVLGRAADADIVLNEERVSRRHAQVFISSEQQVEVEDLDSRNGTFVNGERVTRAELREGDRILVGASVLELVACEAERTMVTKLPAEWNSEAVPRMAVTSVSSVMSGSISEIPLPDLLQLLSTNRKSGVLHIRGDAAEGQILLQHGQIRRAALAEIHGPPRKALFRILCWSSGVFQLDPNGDPRLLSTAEEDEIDESTEALLLEGMRQIDELRQLESELPPGEALVSLADPLPSPLRELSPGELDLVQLILKQHTPSIESLFNENSATDLETAQHLRALCRRGYLLT